MVNNSTEHFFKEQGVVVLGGLSCWIVKASEGKPKSVGTTHLSGFADPTH